jgi:hypothetical protein
MGDTSSVKVCRGGKTRVTLSQEGVDTEIVQDLEKCDRAQRNVYIPRGGLSVMWIL